MQSGFIFVLLKIRVNVMIYKNTDIKRDKTIKSGIGTYTGKTAVSESVKRRRSLTGERLTWVEI